MNNDTLIKVTVTTPHKHRLHFWLLTSESYVTTNSQSASLS
jgi:hypothetical protein